jgi:DNA-binding NarL/FixJ family response regulator
VAFEDGQAILRARLARLFAADAQLRVVSHVDNGPDPGERTLQLTPDSVLLDVWVPTIADGYPQNPTNQQPPMLKVVVLATNFGPETAPAANRRPAVSKRELSILAHVADGQSNKQIGKLLGISTQTVRNHLSRIFHKLGVSNRTEAVMSAMRLRLLIV